MTILETSRQAVDPAILAAVRQAWMAALPNQPFDPSLTWADCGADSIASLNLILRLEISLDRKVSLDTLDPEMTLDHLARALAAQGDRMATVVAPTIFLLPGIYGDQPSLAAFRRRLAGQIQFETVLPPDLDVDFRLHRDILATARLAAEAISARAPDGDLLLAGVSFGGSVAFETARCLISGGRRVRFLGLLDAVLDLPLIDRATGRGEAMRRRSWWTGGARILAVGLFRSLDIGRRMMAGATGPAWSNAFPRLRRRLLASLRRTALEAWRPYPLTAPPDRPMQVWLGITDQFGAITADRWRALSPGLSVARLLGQHEDLLDEASLPPLIAAFEAAVSNALLS